MSAVRIQRITSALATLEALASLPEEERRFRFSLDAGAKYDFSHGTYVLRCAGVTTTQTSGHKGLLAKWQDAARRTLTKLNEVQG